MTPSQNALLTACVCLALYSSLLPDAQAQAPSAGDMARCASVAADKARLACYDQLARSSSVASSAADQAAPTALSPEQSEQSFGMKKPVKAKPAGPARVNAKIVSVATNSAAEVVLQLDNDQTWALDDGPALVRSGDDIVIKRAALGSFLLTTSTGRVYRARRLQ